MRTLLILLIALFASFGTAHAQLPMEAQPPRTEIMYGDFAIGMYGLDIGLSRAPVEAWSIAVYSQWYPGPRGPFYQMDADLWQA